MKAQVPVSTVYPREFAQALVEATQWPPTDRVARIDQITDQLVRRKLARDRMAISEGYAMRRHKQYR